jgi:hypothetical protein
MLRGEIRTLTSESVTTTDTSGDDTNEHGVKFNGDICFC